MSEPRLVAIGRFGRARGVNGDIYLIPYGDDPTRLTGLSKALMMVDGAATTVVLERTKIYSGKLAVKVKGYDTPETAATLARQELFLREDDLRELDDDVHYAFQLIGCQVVSVTDGVEETVGTIKDVENYPASDVYLIEGESGELYRLPAIKEFVRKIDLPERKIEIDPPKGWMEAQ